MRGAGVVATVAALFAAAAPGACASTMEQTEGLDTSVVPSDYRADYAVFAQRCSKCHSLSRPLNSGITGDAYWRIYVEKMRRQPSSGISEADTVPILRFLDWYTAEAERKEKETEKADGG
jgi:hypothetical protein